MPRLRWTLLTIGLVTASVGAVAAQVRPVPAVLITEVPVPAVGRASINTPIVVVDRLLSFDADGDARIARAELPERMQGLLDRGDQNRDGALDSDEIRALLDAQRRVTGGIVRLRTPAPEGLAGVISDLRLSPAKHDQALAILARGHSVPRNVNDATTVDVHAKLRELLDDEEYGNFVAAAARLTKNPNIVIRGVVGGIPAPPR